MAPLELFRTLSDETRMRALTLLMREGELSVGEIAHSLCMVQPKVSRHLAVLRDVGVIDDRRDGQWIFYQLSAKLPSWTRTVLAAAADTTGSRQQVAAAGRALAQMRGRPGPRYRISRVLFFCFSNSCRSQMAEGWARHLGGERLDIRSAGIETPGINTRAIAVMQESGIDISGHESTPLTPKVLDWAELVVTVCDHADEHLLWLPPATRKEYWSLKDPAAATGPEEAVMNVFRASRDQIRDRVGRLVRRIHTAARAELNGSGRYAYGGSADKPSNNPQ
ncbi:MAG: metalloregulator ArsR/SmtB family transcription factor [Acidiferrobacterales bacterium]